ncbi:MAG TPA: hypothetical protein VEJ63_07970 [Planctomycetota bacterium]|nr:hypothetical protein [Planctomycetota bacterium]
MTVRTFLAATALSSLVVLSGCSNKSRNDVTYDDRDTYDDIGETRVFDSDNYTASRRSRTNGTASESVPAPAPIVEAPRTMKPKDVAKKVEKAARKSKSDVASAPRKHVMVGEIDMDQ